MAQLTDEQLRSVKIEQYSKEFKSAAKQVMFSAARLKSPHDRVRVCEWLRKLKELRTDNLNEVIMRNEYMQYLRVSLSGGYAVLTKPFCSQPPEKLVPFAECIANKTCDAIPDIPRCGVMQPILCHKSDDNRAFMCVKRTPDNGLLCYMAVAPDSMTSIEK